MLMADEDKPAPHARLVELPSRESLILGLTVEQKMRASCDRARQLCVNPTLAQHRGQMRIMIASHEPQPGYAGEALEKNTKLICQRRQRNGMMHDVTEESQFTGCVAFDERT